MLRLASAILVIIGVAGGTVSDAVRVLPQAERGGYKIVQADFHVHSYLGDGILSPFSLVLRARHQGLQALAITDHNQIFAAKLARSFSNIVGGPTVLVGEEITAPDFHLIAVGLNERVTWRQSAAEAIQEIHRQGGVAIAAHPTRKYWSAYNENVVRELDGTEVMHPIAYSPGEKGEQILDFYRQAFANARNLAAIGSSDYHWFNSLGLCRTYVFVHNNNESEVLDALRNGRTVVYDSEGKAYGEPELVRLLQDQPLGPAVGDYDYSGAGGLDRVTRACGWVGLLGLVLLGRRERADYST